MSKRNPHSHRILAAGLKRPHLLHLRIAERSYQPRLPDVMASSGSFPASTSPSRSGRRPERSEEGRAAMQPIPRRHDTYPPDDTAVQRRSEPLRLQSSKMYQSPRTRVKRRLRSVIGICSLKISPLWWVCPAKPRTHRRNWIAPLSSLSTRRAPPSIRRRRYSETRASVIPNFRASAAKYRPFVSKRKVSPTVPTFGSCPNIPTTSPYTCDAESNCFAIS
jgi:hypothetical protein